MIWPSVKIGSKFSSFGLVHQFFVAAGITIAVSMALLALAISQRIEISMMQTAAEEGALFIELFLGPSAQDLATSRSLSPESVKSSMTCLQGNLGERVKTDQDLVAGCHACILDQQGTHRAAISFASHRSSRSKARSTASSITLTPSTMPTERHRQVPLVEIYAPAISHRDNEIIAVGEVYDDGRRLAADLASIRLISIGIVGAVTLR